MKIRIHAVLIALSLLSILNPQLSAFAQGTAFTYQGRLNDGANPANGGYDLRFIAYDAVFGGSQQGPVLTNSSTVVSNGLFTATLDFGNQFPGAARWLEIAVRTNGNGGFTTLSPRQTLTPAPYAITAGNVVSGGLTAGTYGNTVIFSNANNNFSGSFSGNGANMTNVNAATLGGLSGSNFWKTAGNSGTTAGLNFVGTTDNQSLELRVNGQRALRIEPTTDTPNLIGGFNGNLVGPGLVGVTIGGGGTVSANQPNLVTNSGSYATIAGGFHNTVANYGGAVLGGAVNDVGGYFGAIGAGQFNNEFGDYSWIGGGYQNTIQTNSYASTISGGWNNLIQGGTSQATIGGGVGNSILNDSSFSNISGGTNNTIQNSAPYSSIGGGIQNQIQYHASGAMIAGGENNQIQAYGYASTITGGYANLIQGTNFDSAIGGGAGNTIHPNASTATIAGGFYNEAGAPGVFIGGGGWDGSHEQANVASGPASAIVGGVGNTNLASAGAIGGGDYNALQINAYNSTIAGGFLNTIIGYDSAIGGGSGNYVDSAGGTIGGGFSNDASGVGAFIGGGGSDGVIFIGNRAAGNGSTIAGGLANVIVADVSSIGGGISNIIRTAASYSAIGGGYQNSISTNAQFATISAGANNFVAGLFATIGGGGSNMIGTNCLSGVISGGFGHKIGNNTWDGTIGGGSYSSIGTNAYYTTIAGGHDNAIRDNAPGAAIGGGIENQITGNYGAIPGGDQNVAGTNAFAAGHRAKANNTGSFVWADSTDADFASTASDQFNVRANGGVRFVAPASANGAVLELKNNSGSPVLFGAINFNDSLNSFAGQISYASMDNGLHFRTGGTDDRMKLNASGLTVNGTFVSASDRNSKENFSHIDSREVLAKVVSLPVTEWNYKQDTASKHIGPMAQDFYAAFGVGPDDRHITTIDESGVALAAIQGLNQKLEQKETEVTELKQRLAALEKIVLSQKSN